MATGFNDNSAILGDVMNFPESSSVKKKEALSNVIFKITQSTERLNKRNERLLQLNLDYDLRVLRLARRKERMTWEKLHCDKLCSSRTNKWLFEEEDMQTTKGNTVDEGLSLPRLSVKQTALSTGKIGHSRKSLRRINTAPTKLLTEYRIRNQRESKSMADLYHVDSNSGMGWTASLGSKDGIQAIHDDMVEIDFPEINKHGRVKWDESIERGGRRRNNEKNFAEKWGNDAISINVSKIEKQLDAINLKDIEKEKGKHSEEKVEKKENSYTKLLKRAEEATGMLSAFIPSGAVYRRQCATRKAYEDTEGKKPRILTRYLREKRAFENLSKCHNKTLLSGKSKEKTSRIVLSYI